MRLAPVSHLRHGELVAKAVEAAAASAVRFLDLRFVPYLCVFSCSGGYLNHGNAQTFVFLLFNL